MCASFSRPRRSARWALEDPLALCQDWATSIRERASGASDTTRRRQEVSPRTIGQDPGEFIQATDMEELRSLAKNANKEGSGLDSVVFHMMIYQYLRSLWESSH